MAKTPLELTDISIINPIAKLSPCNTKVAATSCYKYRYEVLIWHVDVVSHPIRYRRRLCQLDQPVRSLSWSSSGKYLAIGLDYDKKKIEGNLQIWDVGVSQLVKTLPGHTEDTFSLDWNPKYGLLASGSHDGTVKIWDTKTWTLLKEIKNLFIVKPNLKEKLMLALTKKLLKTDMDYSPVQCLAWNHSGNILAYGDQSGHLRLYRYHSDPKIDQPIDTWVGHTNFVSAVAWSPDDRFLATSSNDGTALIWEVSTKKKRQRFRATDPLPNRHDMDKSLKLSDHNQIISASWHPTEQKIALSCIDGKTIIWNLETNTARSQYTAYRSKTAAFPLYRQYGILVTPLWDNGIAISHQFIPKGQVNIDQTGGLLSSQFVLEGHTSTVEAVDLAEGCIPYQPDTVDTDKEMEIFLVSGSQDGLIKFWNVSQKRLLRTLEGHTKAVRSVRFLELSLSLGRKIVSYLASGSEDGTVKIWNTENGHIEYDIDLQIGKIEVITEFKIDDTRISLHFETEKGKKIQWSRSHHKTHDEPFWNTPIFRHIQTSFCSMTAMPVYRREKEEELKPVEKAPNEIVLNDPSKGSSWMGTIRIVPYTPENRPPSFEGSYYIGGLSCCVHHVEWDKTGKKILNTNERPKFWDVSTSGHLSESYLKGAIEEPYI